MPGTHDRWARTMTLIEVRPHSWGWKVFEAPGVEAVFLDQEQAIRLCKEPRLLPLRRDRILDSTDNVERTIAFSEGEERWRKISFDTRLRSYTVRMRQVR
jgi:hypothetical protein